MRRGLQMIVKDLAYPEILHFLPPLRLHKQQKSAILLLNRTLPDDTKSQVYLEDLQKELKLLQENGNWLFANFKEDESLLNSFSENITEAVELQQKSLRMDASRLWNSPT